MTIFRWSLFGHPNEDYQKMTRDSIMSFYHFFKGSARYILVTDVPPHQLFPIWPDFVEIRKLEGHYSLTGTCWLKWAPTARMFPGHYELFIDTDVFCVSNPVELKERLRGDGYVFYMEESREDWGAVGSFADQLKPEYPYVNSGFILQQPSVNIEPVLSRIYCSWLESVRIKDRKPHDEQGGVALALRKFNAHPFSDLYLLISPSSNTERMNRDNGLKGLEVFHSTWGSHPAYKKFKHQIPS